MDHTLPPVKARGPSGQDRYRAMPPGWTPETGAEPPAPVGTGQLHAIRRHPLH
ncbi:MAG: hypothetical protein JRE18_03900 [Deltaproteobacteria bacterium]|nr:hypothetical protein [Deltaproteobacteria bacterium]